MPPCILCLVRFRVKSYIAYLLKVIDHKIDRCLLPITCSYDIAEKTCMCTLTCDQWNNFVTCLGIHGIVV